MAYSCFVIVIVIVIDFPGDLFDYDDEHDYNYEGNSSYI